MAQFFLSKKAIDDIYNTNGIMHEILQKQHTIYVDMEDSDIDTIILDDEGDEYQDDSIRYYDQSANITIKSCHQLIEKIKNDDFTEIRKYESPIIIIDIDKDRAKKVQSSNGIYCLSDAEEYSDILQDKKNVYLEKPSSKEDSESGYKTIDEKKSKHTWESILGALRNVPCNTIVVNDHYLFKDDLFSEERDSASKYEFKNIKEILDILLPLKLEDDVMHLLFLHNRGEEQGKGDTHDWKKVSEVLKKTITKLRPYRMVFEFVSGNNSCHLFSDTHNRNVITNYMIMSAEHKLAAFAPTGEPKADQKISWSQLYAEGISDDSDIPERGKRIFINRVKNIVKYGIDHETSGYTFSQNGMSNPNKIGIKDIKNRIVKSLL